MFKYDLILSLLTVFEPNFTCFIFSLSTEKGGHKLSQFIFDTNQLLAMGSDLRSRPPNPDVELLKSVFHQICYNELRVAPEEHKILMTEVKPCYFGRNCIHEYN